MHLTHNTSPIRLGIALAAPLLAMSQAHAGATSPIVVTTLNDTTDFTGARTPAQLPGPDGVVSFREAVLAANNNPGPDTIHFAIPQEEWWLVSDYALLRLEDGVFLITDDETTIDFSTQADHTGDTNPVGAEVGIYGLQANGWGTPAIIIQASDCVIRGLGTVHLRGAAVSVMSGNNNRFFGNSTTTIELDPYPGTTTGNIIGGTNPGDANDIEHLGIYCGANGNTVIGNRITSVDVVGSRYCLEGNQYPTGNIIGGPSESERNVINGFGRYGSEGYPTGEGIRVDYARDTLIENNYIGVNADGTERVNQRGTAGIRIMDSFNTTVRSNLISGVRVVGINHSAGQIFGQAIDVMALNADNEGVFIENNRIGTDASGLNPITTRAGISVAPFTASRTIRGVRIADNTIAYTELDGIRISSLISGVEIAANSIHDNGLLGIDLISGTPGVTPNDPGDLDAGANGLQNFPVLLAADAYPTNASIAGSLSTLPARGYRIELFASPEADPSGYGEGKIYLGSTTVTTDNTGEAPFEITIPTGSLPSTIADGWVATATATDIALTQTSEFGQALPFTLSLTCAADFNTDGQLNFFDIAAYIDAYNAHDVSADMDSNGQFNFFDIAGFIDAYNAGCP